LDRDNFPENAITTTYVNANAFTRVLQKVKTSTVTLDGSDTTLQTILSYTFQAKYDGMLTVDWSSQFAFFDAATVGAAVPADTFAVTVIVYINGERAAILFRSPDARERDSHVIYGALPVSAGTVKVDVKARGIGVQNNVFKINEMGSAVLLKFESQALVMVFRQR
tara:strand:+ start:508 stop:1005 length:498 start_codon:yes stop_codon:yes gene_type:complete